MDLTFFTDNTVAWAAYCVSALGCLLITWKITAPINLLLLKQVLRILVVAILMTPAPISAEYPQLAPAFMVLLMNLLAADFDAAKDTLEPLLSIMGLGVSIAVVAALVRGTAGGKTS